MFGYDQRSNKTEEDSHIDNASCRNGTTTSGLSTCSEKQNLYNNKDIKGNLPTKVCNKCVELQNPIIMQYYPPPALKKGALITNRTGQTANGAASKNNSNTFTSSSSSQCHHDERNPHRTQYHSENNGDVEETDGEFTEEDDEETTSDGRSGTRVLDISAALAAGLPKHVASVRLSVILIGDTNTGKTSLIARFSDDKLIENYETTIGIDFSIAKFRLNGTSVRLQLWDTAGQEKFNAITTQYYHRAMGVILVYDVTNQSSFDSIAKWNRAVEQHADPDVVKLLCGNKVDLDEERKVTTEQGRKMAQQIGARFCEVSALESTNVFEAFQFFSRDVYREYYAKRNPCASPSAVLLNPRPTSTTEDKSSCCN